MEVEVTQRTCDQCEKQTVRRPRGTSPAYHRGWWRVLEYLGGSHFNTKDLCCVDCLQKYIAGLEKEKGAKDEG